MIEYIDAKEKLPEDNRLVLCKLSDLTWVPGRYMGNTGYGNYWIVNDNICHDVVEWRFLPEK